MKRRCGFLAVVLAPLLLAGFLAPYPYAEQHREHPYVPPTAVHFIRARPFVQEDGHLYPLRLFPGNGRLFGVDPPAVVFLLGSDAYGRDVFSRLLYGGRLSLATGLLATLLSLALGLAAGVVAGYFGGWWDGLLMRGGELAMALPWLYLLLAVRAVLPLHISTLDSFLVSTAIIGAVGWVRPARLIRGVVLSGKERGFVLAARGFGAGHGYLIRRHLLPLTAGVAGTQATLLIPQFMLAEMALSFLGLGVGEPVPSWGGMLNEARQYHALLLHGWLLAPGLAAIPVLLAFLLVADAWLFRRSE
ncbi:MAG: ABC transporter permease [Candidatus Sulfopaludibacter sp.]|nr:ABC transporter permease [Candidatus Sulfopaludibacter sp.]